MTELPLLFSFRRCPYAIRARLAMAVSGITHTVREVDLSSKPPELLAASPKGTVPVLVLVNGEVIDQSLAIMRWALAQHDPDGWLEPVGRPSTNWLALIDGNDGAFKHHLDRYKYPHRHAHASAQATPAELALTHRAGCAAWLATLEPLLLHGYLGGTRVGLADMALLPFVRQCAQTDKTWFAEQSWPRVLHWLQAFESSALLDSVMAKPSGSMTLSKK